MTCLYPRSSHPHIPKFLCTFLYLCILVSSYPYVSVYLLVSSHPYILISSGSYALAYIPAFSYPQVRVYLHVSLHPHILRLIMCLLVYLHPHILISSGSCALVGILASSYPQVNVFSIRMNNRILASSILLVLSTWASQFVNNLQILRTGQAFVLDFYRTSRKIYHKQLLRADLKKNYS